MQRYPSCSCVPMACAVQEMWSSGSWATTPCGRTRELGAICKVGSALGAAGSCHVAALRAIERCFANHAQACEKGTARGRTRNEGKPVWYLQPHLPPAHTFSASRLSENVLAIT